MSSQAGTTNTPGLTSSNGCTSDAPSVKNGDSIRVGNFKAKVGQQLQEMLDSTAHQDNPEMLIKLLRRDGYVLLRNCLDRDTVLAARKVVVESLDKEWQLIDRSDDKLVDDAHILNSQKGVLLTGFRSVTHNERVQRVLEGKEIRTLFAKLFGCTPATFDNKWVRIHGFGENTDEHTDFYRFSGNARGMFTCWIPFGDYNVKQGCLAVCEGSHLLKGYEASVYGKETKVELPPDYTASGFAQSAIWRSTTFRAGDVCVFDIRTIHAATENSTQRFRISMDTRWQPAQFVPSATRGMFTRLDVDGFSDQGQTDAVPSDAKTGDAQTAYSAGDQKSAPSLSASSSAATATQPASSVTVTSSAISASVSAAVVMPVAARASEAVSA